MTVARFLQTDVTTQDATTYKASIDADISVLKRVGDAFAPHAQNTPNMTIALDAGMIFTTTITEIATQSTGTITAPVGNPRIDRVVIDQASGAVSVVTGTPAASPTPPAIPAGKLPVAQILLQTTSSSITNSMITDERAAVWPVTSYANGISTLTVGASPYTYTNASAYAQDVVVSGGTVSAVALGRGAASVTYPTAGPVTLSPGDTVTVTYTAAPTMKVIPR